MKTLYLLRHAKSSHDDDSLDDFDRPLSKRGKRDAVAVASVIEKHCSAVEHIFSSPAKRCRSTIKRVRNALDAPSGELTLDDALYSFDHNDLLNWLKDRDTRLQCILLVGHNPALEDLLEVLTGQGHRHFPTAGFAELQLKVEYWDQIRAGCADLIHFDSPKDLPA
ncbi:phosphohistidine phosphatase [Litorivivens lipolytica]|uniref:Phosphohistidine phosphatase n=1 Tax=Litorivivens lipolytica TaxID=1524264 RepID=A0A7W4W3L3_9GAMM|nr:phosphohistidine phosphatase [Litorivivens lipolytica]